MEEAITSPRPVFAKLPELESEALTSTAQPQRPAALRVIIINTTSGTPPVVSRKPATFHATAVSPPEASSQMYKVLPFGPYHFVDTPKPQGNAAAVALLKAWLSEGDGYDPEQQKGLEKTIQSMNEERDRVQAPRVFP